MTRSLPTVLLVLACVGCASHTPVAVVAKPDDMMSSHEVVLMCTVANAPRPGYAGNDPKPQPSRVAGGSVADAVLYVDGVLKGKFDQPTLRIKNARASAGDDANAVPVDQSLIHDGQRLTVGFDRGPFGVPTNVVVAPEKPKS